MRPAIDKIENPLLVGAQYTEVPSKAALELKISVQFSSASCYCFSCLDMVLECFRFPFFFNLLLIFSI